MKAGWRIVKDHMLRGIASHPPGHADTLYSVRKGAEDTGLHLTLWEAMIEEDVPQVLKDEIISLRKEHPGDTQDYTWLSHCYGLFEGCYSKDGTLALGSCIGIPKDDYYRFQKMLELINRGGTPEWSLAVALVRKFDPEHAPRMDLLPEWTHTLRSYMVERQKKKVIGRYEINEHDKTLTLYYPGGQMTTPYLHECNGYYIISERLKRGLPLGAESLKVVLAYNPDTLRLGTWELKLGTGELGTDFRDGHIFLPSAFDDARESFWKRA